MKTESKGIWIPEVLLQNKDLTIMEKMFIVKINALDGERGCYASNKYFSEYFGLSRSRCSIIINNLKKKGYIVINYFYEKGKKLIERRVIKISKAIAKSISNIGAKVGKTEEDSLIEKNKFKYENSNSGFKYDDGSGSDYDICEIEKINIDEKAVQMDILLEVEPKENLGIKGILNKHNDNKVNEREYSNRTNVNIENQKVYSNKTNKTNENKWDDSDKGNDSMENQRDDSDKSNDSIENQSDDSDKDKGNMENQSDDSKKYNDKKKESKKEEYEEIVGYLNIKCKTNYKPISRKTQRSINARLREGYSVDDFKVVIDKKFAQWSNSSMRIYLRPETLFSTKFERYLNEDVKELGNYFNNTNWRGGQAYTKQFKNDRDSREVEEVKERSRFSNTELTEEDLEWAAREIF